MSRNVFFILSLVICWSAVKAQPEIVKVCYIEDDEPSEDISSIFAIRGKQNREAIDSLISVIQKKNNLNHNIISYELPGGTAAMVFEQDRFVLKYNPKYLNYHFNKGGEWAAVFIIAHEIAHCSNDPFGHAITAEDDADFDAGRYMYKIGAKRKDVIAWVTNYKSNYDNVHESQINRKQKILRGWEEARDEYISNITQKFLIGLSLSTERSVTDSTSLPTTLSPAIEFSWNGIEQLPRICFEIEIPLTSRRLVTTNTDRTLSNSAQESTNRYYLRDIFRGTISYFVLGLPRYRGVSVGASFLMYNQKPFEKETNRLDAAESWTEVRTGKNGIGYGLEMGVRWNFGQRLRSDLKAHYMIHRHIESKSFEFNYFGNAKVVNRDPLNLSSLSASISINWTL